MEVLNMTSLKTTRQLLMAAAVAAALLAATSTSRAQTTNWMGTSSSDWFTLENWSNGVPTSTGTANINTDTPNPTVIGPATPGATAGVVNVANGGVTGMLTIENGGTLSAGSNVTVGNTA